MVGGVWIDLARLEKARVHEVLIPAGLCELEVWFVRRVELRVLQDIYKQSRISRLNLARQAAKCNPVGKLKVTLSG